MARSEWGTIERAGTGRVRIRYWADTGDGTGYRRRSKIIRGTRRDARLELARLQTRYDHGRGSERRIIPATMREAYERWWLPEELDRLESGSLAQATFDLYGTMWRRYVEPAWGPSLIDRIRPMDVQDWLLGLTRWNAVTAKSLAGAIAEKAVMMEAAGRNPFRRDYAMPKGAGERDKSVWTLDEVHRACSALRDTALEVPAILCGFGSCRIGESCAARADEVEVTTERNGMRVARIPITRQLVKRGSVVVDRLKNKQSERTVCIPEPWSSRVEEIARERLSDGLVWLNDNGTGVPVSRSVIQRSWAKSFDDGNPLDEFRWMAMRNLRNSWETYMRWELDVSPDLIDAMMGHAGKGVRERSYDRPVPDAFADTCATAFYSFWRDHVPESSDAN